MIAIITTILGGLQHANWIVLSVVALFLSATAYMMTPVLARWGIRLSEWHPISKTQIPIIPQKTPILSIPTVHKSAQETALRDEKIKQLTKALNDLQNYRASLENSDPAFYPWRNQEDAQVSSLIENAAQAVEFSFNTDHAIVFKSDAGVRKPSLDATYPRYCRALMRLEWYELKLIEKIKELNK
ncbi:MAG TPA: hypothetical protein VFQ43_14285 [Nitrososphaera sp.]|nr:hypothetical protein [Nitrososphaera sp.]